MGVNVAHRRPGSRLPSSCLRRSMRVRSGCHRDVEVAPAGADDLLNGPKLVPIVLRIFVAADGGGGAADAFGHLGLGQSRLLP